MNRFGTIVTLAVLFLCLTGCAGKPENVVKLYLQRICAFDIAGAKKLCTSSARAALGNYHEDLEVQRVMLAGADNPSDEGFLTWEQLEPMLEFKVESKSSDSARVLIKTEDEIVTFTLIKLRGRWAISGISNPTFGLPLKSIY